MTMADVVVIGGFAPALVGFRGALLQSLAASGCRVTACAPERDPAVERALAGMGVAYRPIPFTRNGIGPGDDLGLLARLHGLFRELRPDIVLTNTIKPVIYGSLAARAVGVPRVVSLISGLGFAFGEARGLRQRIVGAGAGLLYRLALAGNHTVLFQNPDDRDLFVARGLVPEAGRTQVVNGSGVDLTEFAPAPPVTAPHFLMIARLIGAKGVREYAAASRILRRRWPEVRCRLIGWADATDDTIGEAELRSWIEAGDIEHLGRREDIRPDMARAAVYVLPSYYREGTPRSTLEALAMGRPVVTTDMPGCRETVRHGENGLLVRPRDAQGLADAMARFVEQPELIARYGAASRRLAESRYDVHAVNRQIMGAMGL